MNATQKFNEKVDEVSRQIMMDILAARVEMFPFGSEVARRRYDKIMDRELLKKAIIFWTNPENK